MADQTPRPSADADQTARGHPLMADQDSTEAIR